MIVYRRGISKGTPREFWPWADIAYCYKRGAGDNREVLTVSFKGEPVWVPWMGTEER